jgi:hypothetical protein
MPQSDSLPDTKSEGVVARAGLADFEQVHLISYMQLADAKAAVFLAITSGAIAYIAGHYGLGWLHGEHFMGHSLLLTLTTLVLVGSAALSIAVIVPRKFGRRDSIIFYHEIAQLGTPALYLQALAEMSDAEIFNTKMAYCHSIAKICNRKYRLLNLSLIFGIVGYAMFLALLLWR